MHCVRAQEQGGLGRHQQQQSRAPDRSVVRRTARHGREKHCKNHCRFIRRARVRGTTPPTARCAVKKNSLAVRTPYETEISLLRKKWSRSRVECSYQKDLSKAATNRERKRDDFKENKKLNLRRKIKTVDHRTLLHNTRCGRTFLLRAPYKMETQDFEMVTSAQDN